ncbi:MAG: hypothetical protein Q4D71_13975, partial [Oscillospiraceae bacterium]|nr:hypothetical protein [Oscillospiraceae bacterium]
EIEPKEDVSVSIKYANTVDLKSGEASIVHFADKGTEVLKVDTRRDVEGGKESVNVFDFKQGSFSVSGTVVTADSISTAQYFIVAESEGQYYALKNDGSAVPVTYNSNLGIYTIENDSDAQACLWNVMHTYGDRYVISQDDGKCLFINGYNIFGSMDPEIIADPQGGGTFSLLHAGGWDTYTTLTFDNNTFGTADYYEQYGWVTRYGWYYIPYQSWEKVGDNAAKIHFAKYSIETSGTVPDPQSFPGSDVDPDDVADWLADLFDDAMIDASGCTKTAEVFDYENRIYQIDMTAKSSARAFVRNIDMAFSFDFSNSMLFPANLTPMGTIELSERELNGLANANRISRDKVYFVISDVDATATVTAVFYTGGKWYQQDASKFAREQAKNANGNAVSRLNTNSPTKIRDMDTGYYTLYSAPQGYVDYILDSDKPIVYENTYNRL